MPPILIEVSLNFKQLRGLMKMREACGICWPS